MNISDIVDKALEHGVFLYIEDGKLKYRAKKGGLTQELKDLLQARRDEIIAHLKKMGSEPPAAKRIPLFPQTDKRDVPLSFGQQRLWFLDRLGEGSSQYNCLSTFRLTGPFDREAFGRAVKTVVERHEILRTVVAVQDGEPRQVALDRFSIEPVEVGLAGATDADFDESVRAVQSQESSYEFDLERDLMIRVHLIPRSDEDHAVVVNVHHIATDAWSMRVLVAELGRLYGAYRCGLPDPLPPLPLQYSDYAVWQRSWLEGEELERQIAYWKGRLAGIPAAHALPLERARAEIGGNLGDSVKFALDSRQLERAEALSRTYDTTLFVLLETVFALLVGRCSQTMDVVIGTPTFGRNRQELESLIGFFINTIALRTDLAGDPSFEDLLRRNRADVLRDYEHQFLPFENIVKEVNPPREANLSPVFQIMFTVERESDDWSPFPSLRFDRVSKQKETIKYEIVFSVYANPSAPQIRLAFNTELFDAGAMRCMSENYAALLDAILADPARPIDDYRLAHEAVVVRIPEEMAAHRTLVPLSAVAGTFAVVGATGSPTPLGGIGELVYACDTNEFDAGGLAFRENDIGDLPGRYLLRTGLAASVGDDRAASFPVGAGGSDRPPSERSATSAPSGPVEEALCRIWRSILQVETVGREDNFFRLGGHSLLVMQLVSAIREEFGCEPGIRDIFERPTLAELAGFIAAEAARNALPPIVHLGRQGGLPLSYAQQRLWFIDRMEGGSVHYNMLFRIKFREAVDEDAFAEAVRQVVQRHEVLRTYYAEVDGEPRQFVREAFDIEPRVVDIRHLDASEQGAEFNRLCREEVLRPFDLGADQMLRALLVKFNDGYARAIFTQHHIASDGWSIQLLKRELTGIYKSLRDRRPVRLKRLAAQYADYAGWQRSWLQGEVLSEEQAYWSDRLAGIPQIHSLPLDKPRPGRQTFEARVCHRILPDDIAAGIRALAADHGMTLFMVLQTAFAIVLSRYSRERDIVMGSPISGRVHRDLEPMLGFFVNTLVLRSQVDPERMVVAQLEDNRKMLLEAFNHQHIPFEYLVEVLKPKRSLSHPPLFQILFNMLEAGEDVIESTETDVGDRQGWSEGIEKFDLTLTAVDGGERVGLVWSMNAALFEEASIERLHASLECVLGGMVSTPEMAVGELPLMDAAARRHLLETLAAGAGVRYPQDRCLHELFEAQVARTPEAEAVVYQGQVLRFGELNAAANRLAHHLLGCGVEPGDRVALCLERGVELVVALLGIWKSGAAYVPLDPEAPEARQAYLLEDSAPRLLVTSVGVRDRLPSLVPTVVLDAVETVEALSRASEADPQLRSRGLDAGYAAYVIYTSGSTGLPKGVVVEHRSVAHLWRALEELLSPHGPGPWRVGLNASVIFDASVQSLVHLLSGHALVVVPQGCRLDPQAFLAYMRSQRVDVFDCTPALLELLVAEGLLSEAAAHAPRAVLVGGEAIAAPLWRKLREAPRTVFYNNYGPTECTVQATACALPASGERPTLGGALGNARLYVLDESGEPVPVGVPGELWIGGDGVARGYWNRAELTAERFVRDRFVAAVEARMYRTGDLCRWLPEGTLEYLGRTDFQVKIRGYRIELGEIEAQLSSCAGVREAVVLAREVGGERRLVGYALVEAGSEATASGLKRTLSERLPEYMVPSSLLLLEAWPLTPNGKVDRGALQSPEEAAGETDYVAPRTQLELEVSAVWSEVLGVARVGATDNFFELGGHSLLAMRLVSALRAQCGVELEIREVFELPTVEAQAARLSGRMGGVSLPALRTADRSGPLPLSYTQQRLWFIDRFEGGAHYNVPQRFTLRGEVDSGAFARALRYVMERHEVLRTRYVEASGEPRQRIETSYELPLEEVDLRALPEAERRARYRALGHAASRRFELSEELPLRVLLVRLEAERSRVVVVQHHIATDAWSSLLLKQELRTAYAAYARGEEPALPALRWQYADYAVWQRSWLQGEVLKEELDYWRSRLSGLPVRHGLALDHARPLRQRFEGRAWGQALSPGLAARLRELALSREMTLYMVLQTAFAIVLSRYSRERDIVMGSPISGRVHRDLEPMLGFFVNTLVLRSQVDPERTVMAQLDAQKRMLLEAYGHQHVPFEYLVEALQPERSLSHPPLFQILFNLLERGERGETSKEGLEGWSEGFEKFDLTLTAIDGGERVGVVWSMNAALFEESSIERLHASLECVLWAMVSTPEMAVGALPLMDAAARHAVVETFNATSACYPREATIHGLFEAQARRTPEALALAWETERLDYATLNRRANAVARRLIALGVGPEDRVGICATRRPELVVGLLGILKSGAGYVPLDPAYPAERLSLMVSDSAPKAVLTVGEGSEAMAWRATVPVLALESLGASESAEEPEVAGLVSSNLAYVIYTSGSTGVPKGVMIEHRNAVNLLTWAHGAFTASELETVLFSTSINFDLAVYELFVPLTRGHAVRLVRDALSVEAELEATLANTVPSAMSALVETGGLPRRVETVNLAGEPLKRSLVERLFATTTVGSVVNLYGPTETTTYSTWVRMTRSEGFVGHIGRPLANTRLYVLDEHGEPVPVGVPGELWIGGDGVARGYWNRAELTAERFVRDRFVAAVEARMYRTGDLCRWLPEGTLEYLGRTDFQVKIRGYRIELGEIEAQLSSCAGVREAVVLAREVGGERRLVGYALVEAGSEATASGLKRTLSERLPEYMVPSSLLLLEAWPLTPNGKVDRGALPSPEEAAGETDYVAPRTQLELEVSAVWSEVLGVARVGATDNFFELGGHSLLAMRLVSALRAQCGVELEIREVFELPTVEAQAARLSSRGRGVSLPALSAADRSVPLPLSYAQQRLWFIDRFEGGAHYNVPQRFTLTGRVDGAAFARALSWLLSRHEVLRTRYVEASGEPRQRIEETYALPLEEVDLRDLPEDARRERYRSLAYAAAMRRFELSEELPLRVLLVHLEAERSRVVVAMHHIATDAWSSQVLERELRTAYAAYARGEEPALPALRWQYADYAVWQRSWLQGEVLKEELDYWRSRLSGLPVRHGLSLDHARPARQRFEGKTWRRMLSPGLVTGLRALSRARGMTLYMVLQTAFAIVLSRYSRERDIVMGSPISGRVHRDLEPMLGFFVNTLVLRSQVDAGRTVAAQLEENRKMLLEAYAHQHVPFEYLVEALQPERSLSHPPLFQILFNLLEGGEREQTVGAEEGGWSEGIEKFDLTLTAVDGGERVGLVWSMNAALFEEASIERLHASLECVLGGMVSTPEMAVGALPLMDAAARHAVVETFNATSACYPREATIHGLFEAQARRTPEALALAWETERLDYATLNRRANAVARRLIALGVGPEDRVGICATRRPELVVGLLGILKSGAGYVPLDPAYPAERLSLMVSDSAPKAVLTVGEGSEAMAWRATVPVLALESLGASESAEEPEVAGLVSSNLAYVIYTSGSTGVPKGVMIEHRNAVNLLTWAHGAFTASELETVLFSTSINFDLAVYELFVPLTRGHAVRLVRDALSVEAELEATLANTVPSAMSALVETGGLPRRVETVNLAGEPLKRSLVERLFATTTVGSVVNLYGPTETTTYSTWVRMTRSEGFVGHIGRPLANTRLYVLDEHGEPVPVGVPGELWIGGDGVARGYWNRAELTAERFVRDRFVAAVEARMYRTGDLCRWLPEGTLEYLGRTDFQVKIRGYRIELGEIEAQLSSCAGVREAVVLAREVGGERRLVGYALVEAGSEATASGLKRTLSERLPEYMVPSSLLLLEAWPLTPNGKVDRGALPSPEEAAGETDYVAPRTQLELEVSAVWSEVLGVARVGATDNFFELGGHSLLAMRLVSALRAQCGVELEIREVFELPTVEAQAARLSSRGRGVSLPALSAADRSVPLPLSYAQQRLWFIDRFEGGAHYNVPQRFTLTGRVDGAAFARALSWLLSRHEVLRTRYVEASGEPRQRIEETYALPLEEVDLRDLPEDARRERYRSLAYAAAMRRFELSEELPLRVLLVHLEAERSRVVVAMHHIATDAWSSQVLERELRTAYAAYARGEEPALPALRWQYADYAVWQRSWLQGEVLKGELDYWRSRLSGLPVRHGLSLDHARPARQRFEGKTWRRMLSPGLVTGLRALSRARGMTLYMVLQTAFAIVLSRYSRERDIVMGSPISGRVHRDLEPMLGFFVNTLVLRSQVDAGRTVAAQLEENRKMLLEAYAHQHVPFEYLVEALQPERSLSHPPLFQILFNLLEGGEREQTVGAEEGGWSEGIEKFDLTLTAVDGGERVGLVWSMNAALFEEASIERLHASLECVLGGMVSTPEMAVGELPLMDAAARRHLLETLAAGAGVRYPQDRCLHELFEAQVVRTPEAEAVVYQGQVLRFGELNAAANRLAHHLLGCGVEPGDRVALCLERGVALVVALLGIWKSGAAYVPLDPEAPEARQAYLLEDSAPRLLVTSVGVRDRLPSLVPTVVLDAVETVEALSRASEADPQLRSRGLDAGYAAYVIYTSGSTGLPKGVVVEHRSVAHLWRALEELLSPHGPGPWRVGLNASVIFDASVQSLVHLLSGHALVVVPQGCRLDPQAFLAYMRSQRVDVFDCTPALLELLVAEGLLSEAAAHAPRAVLVGGEAIAAPLWRKLREAPRTVFYNNYGPTECTVQATACALPASGERPTLGGALGNARLYVLDEHGEPVPVGVPGELWIGGDGVARGYWNRAELTAERFVRDRFVAAVEARMYRTGDLCRWLPEGTLEYLGRTDFQVKIRGYRIELGEIEAQLSSCAGVREAVVLAREVGGERRLVGYALVEAGSEATASGLKRTLSERLPEYMVPSSLLLLEAWPLTPNGKVDRGALQSPEEAAGETDYVAPRTQLELEVSAVWSEVLGVARVGATDNFFELGGHSLLAVKVVAEMRRRLGCEVSLVDLFQYPVVAELSAFIAGTQERPEVRASMRELAAPIADAPVFHCIPGVAALAKDFVPIAAALRTRGYGVKAFDHKGVLDDADPHASVAEIANAFLAEIAADPDTDVYNLVGHSFGGVVALEIAKRLRDAGKTVNLYLLDVYFEQDGSRYAIAKRSGIRRFPHWEVEGDIALKDRVKRIREHQGSLFSEYVPQGTNAIRPLCVFAAESGVDRTQYAAYLSAMFRDGFQSVVVDGDHFTMLGSAGAAAIAEALHRSLLTDAATTGAVS